MSRLYDLYSAPSYGRPARYRRRHPFNYAVYYPLAVSVLGTLVSGAALVAIYRSGLIPLLAKRLVAAFERPPAPVSDAAAPASEGAKAGAKLLPGRKGPAAAKAAPPAAKAAPVPASQTPLISTAAPSTPVVPLGLPNLGNTCYWNSTLQALVSLPRAELYLRACHQVLLLEQLLPPVPTPAAKAARAAKAAAAAKAANKGKGKGKVGIIGSSSSPAPTGPLASFMSFFSALFSSSSSGSSAGTRPELGPGAARSLALLTALVALLPLLAAPANASVQALPPPPVAEARAAHAAFIACFPEFGDGAEHDAQEAVTRVLDAAATAAAAAAARIDARAAAAAAAAGSKPGSGKKVVPDSELSALLPRVASAPLVTPPPSPFTGLERSTRTCARCGAASPSDAPVPFTVLTLPIPTPAEAAERRAAKAKAAAGTGSGAPAVPVGGTVNVTLNDCFAAYSAEGTIDGVVCTVCSAAATLSEVISSTTRVSARRRELQASAAASIAPLLPASSLSASDAAAVAADPAAGADAAARAPLRALIPLRVKLPAALAEMATLEARLRAQGKVLRGELRAAAVASSTAAAAAAAAAASGSSSGETEEKEEGSEGTVGAPVHLRALLQAGIAPDMKRLMTMKEMTKARKAAENPSAEADNEDDDDNDDDEFGSMPGDDDDDDDDDGFDGVFGPAASKGGDADDADSDNDCSAVAYTAAVTAAAAVTSSSSSSSQAASLGSSGAATGVYSLIRYHGVPAADPAAATRAGMTPPVQRLLLRSAAHRRTELAAIPPCFVVHLNRLVDGGMRKIQDQVSFPLEADFSPLTRGGSALVGPAAAATKAPRYRLRSVVVHHGSAQAGHYVALRRLATTCGGEGAGRGRAEERLSADAVTRARAAAAAASTPAAVAVVGGVARDVSRAPAGPLEQLQLWSRTWTGPAAAPAAAAASADGGKASGVPVSVPDPSAKCGWVLASDDKLQALKDLTPLLTTRAYLLAYEVVEEEPAKGE